MGLALLCPCLPVVPHCSSALLFFSVSAGCGNSDISKLVYMTILSHVSITHFSSTLSHNPPPRPTARPALLSQVLTRTQDGNEGGRHQLIKATISGGNLYLLKAQAGDKRWFKGTNKELYGTLSSFTVA